MEDKTIHKFVLTGGSCGGKTTATLILPNKLEKLGYKVFVVSEVSTELDFKGYTLERLGREEFQRRILQWQIEKEKIYIKKAQSMKQSSIIICDRGALDGSAYITEAMFNELLKEIHINKEDLYKRYDAIFHMTSIAVDVPEKYENTSNPMRREDIAASRIIDRKLQEIWSKHPNRIIIDNSTELQMKIERVFLAMKKYLEKSKTLEEK